MMSVIHGDYVNDECGDYGNAECGDGDELMKMYHDLCGCSWWKPFLRLSYPSHATSNHS